MSEVIDLAALVSQPFDLLREIERRSARVQKGAPGVSQASEWVGVGFCIGDERFIADREQVREVLMLPESVSRVPGAKRWLLGIANLRGHLLPLIDLKLMLGNGRTAERRATRVISVNHRETPAGLVVDEVLGFRRFTRDEHSDGAPQTVVRCDRFLEGSYQRDDETWAVFNLFDLLESPLFLQASAE